MGLSRFGAFDQASYRHYSQDLRVAYVGPRSGAALVRDMRESLRGPQRNTDNNSYARLREEFTQQDVERLMRLFNGALFSLPLGERGIELDDSDVWVKSLEAVLDGFKGERFEAPGLSIDLTSIEPPASK